MPHESKIIVGRPHDMGSTASVFAYGDADDASRLVVLLADRVLACSESTSDAARHARHCLEPRTVWRDRLSHLASALHDTAEQRDEPFIALWDADALAAVRPESWDHEHSSLLRRELFGIIREAVRNGGWILVRTAPEHESATAFDDLDIERVSGEQSRDGIPEASRIFAPECAPVCAWLIARDILQPHDFPEIRRTVGRNAEEHLIDLAYGSLADPARDSAALLTALRAPQERNGHYGRLAFSNDTVHPSSTALPAAARWELVNSGMIQPTWDSGPWRMPRLIRKRLDGLARITMNDTIQQLHRSAAETSLGAANISAAAQVEAHFHAACTNDVELAVRTATYYGSELCEVARRLSIRAQDSEDGSEKRQLFLEAAALFRHVLDKFDETDAYAWEYFGYNLARASLPRGTSSPDASAILGAYARAHQLRPGNPLYHGRYLGFRGQLGERIVEETLAGLIKYSHEAPEREPFSFFAKAVFDGLWRGGQNEQAWEIKARHPLLLQTLAPQLRLEWVQR